MRDDECRTFSTSLPNEEPFVFVQVLRRIHVA